MIRRNKLADSVGRGPRDKLLAALATGDDYVQGSAAIAQYLGLSVPTALKLIHAGGIPAFLVGNKLRVSKRLLDTWLLLEQLKAVESTMGAPARVKARPK